MKRRLSLLLSLCLAFTLLPPALAAEETSSQPVAALCAAEPDGSAFLDRKEFQLLCLQATGHELESVSFSISNPRMGTLTYKGEPIEAGAAYYPYENPQLSKICFTPYAYRSSRATGQGEVPFTMTSENGETVPGTLILYVPEAAEPPEVFQRMAESATVKAGEPLALGDYLPDELWYPGSREDGGSWYSDSTGTYVSGRLTQGVFTLPSPSQGCLWLNYGSSDARKVFPEEVLSATGDPGFYDVFFVPADKEPATVRLDYTASCEKEEAVPGSLTLQSLKPQSSHPSGPDRPETVSVSTQSTPAGLTDALRLACSSLKVGALQTVAFDDLPAAGEGTVLSGQAPVTLGKAYPCEGLTFVPGPDFRGGLSLRYTGTDSVGFTFSGYLDLHYGYPSGLPFQDLAGWEWAMPAAEFLADQGYRQGESAFCPGETATRMDLIHALILTAYSGRNWDAPVPSFTDLPQDEALARDAAAAVKYGLVLGDGSGRLLPDEPVTRQDALVMLHRAFTDRRRLPSLSGGLSAFSDAAEMAPYAKEAVEDLTARGVLLGNGSGQLSPLSPITRAEMACLLYRAFS